MEHNLTLISTIAGGFGMALVLGLVAERLRVPALVGYLVAGVILGPATPGIVADQGIASQLSEIGVMLLMFGVGLHFSPGDLLAVKRIAIPGAVAQMGLATLLGMLLAKCWGWHWGSAFVFGLSLSCASTVVLLKALEAQGSLESMNGRIAIGWLVVEDLATVLALVLLPPLASLLGDNGEALAATGETAAQGSFWTAIGITLLRVSAFILLMLVVGQRLIPWLLRYVERTGSRELFTLSVIATAIGIAYGAAEWFHVSFALGAFFAGMVMRESPHSHRAAAESLPLRDAFSVLFFVSVGMLFEPGILLDAPFKTFAVVTIIILGKSLAAAALVLAFRYPLRTALTVAVSLAQIGEFSFILGGLGMNLGLLTKEGMSLILAASLIAIALNPLLFAAIPAMQRWLLDRYDWARRLDRREAPFTQLPTDIDRKALEGQVVLAGYGRVGQRIAGSLTEHGIPFVIAEQNRECVEKLRKKGIPAVWGDAAEPAVLIQAHIAKAAMLVVATPSLPDTCKMVETARTLNPDIEIVARTHNDKEKQSLNDEGIGAVFFGEEELARSMCRHVVERFSPGVQVSRRRVAMAEK